MTASTLFLLVLVAMMCCSRPVSGLVYQTRDAIIMEGDDISTSFPHSPNSGSLTFKTRPASCTTREFAARKPDFQLEIPFFQKITTTNKR